MANEPDKKENKTDAIQKESTKSVKKTTAKKPATSKSSVKKTTAKKTVAKKIAEKEKLSPVEAGSKAVLKTTSIKKAAINEKAPETPAKEIIQTAQVEGKQKLDEKKPDRGALFLGLGLLVFGVVLMVGRLLSISFGEFIWPFLFIVPGGLFFAAALSTDDRHGEGLSILGSIFLALGFVFLFQSISGMWASWAYLWALIAPTSIGIGQLVYGTSKNRDSIKASGRRLINLGLVLFGFGFVFFELILDLSGFGLKRYGIPPFPAMLIFLGVFILVRSIIRKR